MKLNEFGALSNEKLKSLELKLNRKLPEDYKNFLRKTGGGIAEKEDANSIFINDLQSSVTLDVLFGYDNKNKNANIDTWMELLSDDLIADSVIIGDDIMQGLFILVVSGENQGVYYWDDSYYFDESSDEGNTYFIARTFHEFYEMIQ